MTYTIRNCEKKDLPVLIELCKAHADYERTAYNGQGKLPRLDAALFAEQPVLFCWVVEVDGTVVGYTAYVFEFTTWDAGYLLFMDCLYLLPPYRGFGIGRDIMQRLMAVAQQKGCVAIEWQTPQFNEDGIRFYKKLGAEGKDKVRFAWPVGGVKGEGF